MAKNLKPHSLTSCGQFEAILASDASGSTDGAAAAAPAAAEESAEAENGGWKIVFRPGKDILRTGNQPIRMFRELQDLGELSIEAHTDNLVGFSALNPEDCLLSWTLTLKGEGIALEDINEVFEWVIDESDITIDALEGAAPSQPAEQQETAVAAETSVEAEADPAESNKESAAPDKKAPAKANKPTQKTATSESSIRVGIDKVDNLINMVGELVITQSMLGQLGNEFSLDRLTNLQEGLVQLEQNTRELQESVMRIRMLPISFTFSRFPRMVRDLTRRLGKKIDLKLMGEQTELDKTVMEKIGDPLVHLVRNALDHGIEMPDVRAAAGKPETGTITLNAYHQGGNIIIEIIDDGKGLPKDKLVEKAIKNGLISETDHLTEDQIHELIFHPGFSTAQEVSDLSGRGVGMDVVRRNIQELNGTVDVTSKEGEGSKFSIRLPLTLAILDGQLLRVGHETYIFPLVSIVESLQIKQDQVSSVAGGCDVLRLRDEYVPIVRLYEAFNLEPENRSLENALLVVVEADGEKVGIMVDELLAQQQVVIKSMEQNYRRVEGISGATILGDGTVALIIDLSGIVKLAGIQESSSQLTNLLLASQEGNSGTSGKAA